MQTFEPDQLVLVRYFEGAPWRLRRYSMPCKKGKAHETQDGMVFVDACIIPYSGNEHLLGTTESPGPWKVATWYGGYHTIRPKKEPEKSLGKIERKHDAACNAVPELVARIRELEAQLYEAVGYIISDESQTMIDCRICCFASNCERGKDQCNPDHDMCQKAILSCVAADVRKNDA